MSAHGADLVDANLDDESAGYGVRGIGPIKQGERDAIVSIFGARRRADAMSATGEHGTGHVFRRRLAVGTGDRDDGKGEARAHPRREALEGDVHVVDPHDVGRGFPVVAYDGELATVAQILSDVRVPILPVQVEREKDVTFLPPMTNRNTREELVGPSVATFTTDDGADLTTMDGPHVLSVALLQVRAPSVHRSESTT